MKVETGRPEDISGRLPQEINCYALLDSLQIAYTRVDHAAAETIEACLARSAVLGVRICKNLFLCNRQETAFYLLVMPADKQFRTSRVSAQLGVSRLHFAGAAHMAEYLGLRPGSVSILGLMNDRGNRVRLLMDRELLSQEYFACHPCVNTSSLKLRSAELFEKLIPAMGHAPACVEL
ncbi:MAG: prolyl-tRNA synthetase associated domain-containing protein [Oscillospiraceae bacterium]|jgi:Ala-tRNA(Pro) deacylase|nr:prolyl-tRNA synthetase associated domain-containing protein [Oscillospiraceae bacterium]